MPSASRKDRLAVWDSETYDPMYWRAKNLTEASAMITMKKLAERWTVTTDPSSLKREVRISGMANTTAPRANERADQE